MEGELDQKDNSLLRENNSHILKAREHPHSTAAEENDLFKGSVSKAPSQTEHVKREAFKVPNTDQRPPIQEESK